MLSVADALWRSPGVQHQIEEPITTLKDGEDGDLFWLDLEPDKTCHHESVTVQVIKCTHNCDTTRKLHTRLRELSTTPNWRLFGVTTPTTRAWLKTL